MQLNAQFGSRRNPPQLFRPKAANSTRVFPRKNPESTWPALFYMEQTYLYLLLERSNQEVHQACSIWGLSRARLYELLKKHNIALNS